MRSGLLSMFVCCLLLAGTAQAVESLVIQLPSPEPVKSRIIAGHIGLVVTDARVNTLPGLDVNGEALRIDNSLQPELQAYVERGLIYRGWVIQSMSDKPEHALKVELLELSYRASRKMLRTSVEVVAVIRATVRKQRTTLKKTFRARNVYGVPLTPSRQKNASMLRKALVHALDAMLDDPEVQNLLR